VTITLKPKHLKPIGQQDVVLGGPEGQPQLAAEAAAAVEEAAVGEQEA
jgi:hypothetical protein